MHDSTNGVFAIRKLSALVRLAPRVNHFIRYNLTISGRIRLAHHRPPLPNLFNLLPNLPNFV